MAEMRKDMLQMFRSNQQVNSVTPSCETCGGPHSYYECQAVGGYTQDVYATTGNYNSGGNAYQPQGDRNLLSYRSNNFLGPPGFNPPNNQNQAGPSVPIPHLSSSSKEVERDPETITDQVLPESTARVPPLVVQPYLTRSSELLPSPSNVYELPKRNPHQPPIPYPSRLNKEKLQDKYDIQIHKFLQMFKKLHFNISLADALALMPKYAKMLKDLLSDKEKLLGLANTSLTKNCSVILLKKLPKKLGDPGKFLIPCDFLELEKCMALANLGASIKLIPFSNSGKKLDWLPDLIPTRKFTFPADLVVVDYDIDPRVPLILGRPFLRTARALVDVYGEELILRDGDEKLIFHADSTSKHPHKHGNEWPVPLSILILFQSHHTVKTSDSFLEEFADELALLDPFPPGNEDDNFDPEADPKEIEYLLNRDPSIDSSPTTNIDIIDPILERLILFVL
ncbi:hypothetical protein Tco_0984225 [Tanacetum coccineum]